MVQWKKTELLWNLFLRECFTTGGVFSVLPRGLVDNEFKSIQRKKKDAQIYHLEGVVYQ